MTNFKFAPIALIITLLTAQTSFALYTPQQALSDATSEPLIYMGKFIPSSSESGLYPECVFKNSKIIVISSYCVKKNVPAGRLFLLPADASQGNLRLYAETAANKDISVATHSEYEKDFFYSAAMVPKKPHDFNMTFEQIRLWSEGETIDQQSGYCVTANSQSANANSTSCKNVAGDTETWAKASFSFLTNSDPNFVHLLRQIKTQVP